MQIKVDEDLPNLATQCLRDRGYQADSVVDQKMGGWKDVALWVAVQAEQRFFVTADKEFANIRVHPLGSHAGVLSLRPDEDGIRPVMDLLAQVLDNFDLNTLSGAVTVATPRGVRIRWA